MSRRYYFDQLIKGFFGPSAEARPGVCWWWEQDLVGYNASVTTFLQMSAQALSPTMLKLEYVRR